MQFISRICYRKNFSKVTQLVTLSCVLGLESRCWTLFDHCPVFYLTWQHTSPVGTEEKQLGQGPSRFQVSRGAVPTSQEFPFPEQKESNGAWAGELVTSGSWSTSCQDAESQEQKGVGTLNLGKNKPRSC